MVIEKYHFHLGLHKVFVMFAAMFFVRSRAMRRLVSRRYRGTKSRLAH